MSAYSRIKLTHANLKRDIFLLLGTIVGYHYSDSSKSTHVYTAGGGVFPAVESPDEIHKMIDEITINANQNKEK